VLRFVIQRLVGSLPLVLGAATLVFVVIETAPGNPADLMLGDRPVPPEVRQRVERAYGFDRPPLERYVSWIGGVFLRGDLGWSHSRSRPVAALLAEALPPTLLLAGAALLLHTVLGIVLGALAAAWRERWPDRALSLASLLLYAMPTFWLGLMSILLLCHLVPLFPASSMRSVGAEAWSIPARMADAAWHLALPAIVLGAASAAGMARFVRAGLLEALGQEFIRAGRARGLGSGRLLWRHALRNALLPVINLAGLSLPVLVSGSLVTEVVFAWPGMGRLTYDAILAQDVPVVLASTLLAAWLVGGGNLAADLAMLVIDPRIRLVPGRSRA
jgi:peptide/nickel transport system permease protein